MNETLKGKLYSHKVKGFLIVGEDLSDREIRNIHKSYLRERYFKCFINYLICVY